MIRLRRMISDRRGATIVEFALIAPVFLGLLMGMFDIAHQLYMTAALQGSVQKAARDSSLESGTDTAAQAAFDRRVTSSVYALSNNAKIKVSRRFYRTFADASARDPESWTDTNKNGRCDNKEPYQDENNNQVWDADGGDAGQGTAKDRTVYTVQVTFPRFFPFWRYFGVPNAYDVSAKTVLQNQPYSDQQNYGAATVRNCP